MSAPRTLARYAAYPALTGGAVLFCLFALARGWSVIAIGLVVVVAACVAAALLERLIPYSAAWSRAREDLGTDAWHLVLSDRALELGGFLAIALLVPAGAWLTAQAGFSPWPTSWPLAGQVVLAITLLELPSYALHRLEHTHPLAWRLHAVHHSAERMYWLNFHRQHPLDNLLTAFLSVGLVSLVGAPEAPLAVAAAFSTAHGMLQHANADLRTGPLDLLLATPRVHRWHHSRVPAESMANYGGVVTLWDHVFRSRFVPADRAPPEDVGLYPSSAPFPPGFLAQLASPFVARVWARPGA